MPLAPPQGSIGSLLVYHCLRTWRWRRHRRPRYFQLVLGLRLASSAGLRTYLIHKCHAIIARGWFVTGIVACAFSAATLEARSHRHDSEVGYITATGYFARTMSFSITVLLKLATAMMMATTLQVATKILSQKRRPETSQLVRTAQLPSISAGRQAARRVSELVSFYNELRLHPTLNGQWVYHDGVTMHPYWAYRRLTPAR